MHHKVLHVSLIKMVEYIHTYAVIGDKTKVVKIIEDIEGCCSFVGKMKVASNDHTSFSLLEMVLLAKEITKHDLEHLRTDVAG